MVSDVLNGLLFARETLRPNGKGASPSVAEEVVSWQPVPQHKQSPLRPTPVNTKPPIERWPTDERRPLTLAPRQDVKHESNDRAVAKSDGTEAGATVDLGSLQQLDSLVTKLQSQKARLNWMIEAVWRQPFMWLRPVYIVAVLFTALLTSFAPWNRKWRLITRAAAQMRQQQPKTLSALLVV